MRLSILTLSSSFIILILQSAHLHAQPVQSAIQVNPIYGQTASQSIQPIIVSGRKSNPDPRLKRIADFLITQKKRVVASQASANTTRTTNLMSVTSQTLAPMTPLSIRMTSANTPRQIIPASSAALKQTPLHVKSHVQSSPIKTDDALHTAQTFLTSASKLLRLDNPQQELTLAFNKTDHLGKNHLRFQQHYQGLPVWKCELTVHLNKTGDVEMVDGMFYPSPKKLSTTPIYTAEQATETARDSIPLGINAAEIHSPRLVIYPEQDKQTRLAWEITLSAGFNHQWLILVDAHNGEHILAYNQANDVARTGSGQDLFGIQQQLNLFESGNQFFMADTSKPMFKGGSPFPVTSETGAIYILDDRNQANINSDGEVELPESLAVASSRNRNNWPEDTVSAAFTLSATYDYYSQVHSRNSIDGNGGSIFAVVRVGRNYANAFWNGQVIAFGDAIPFAGALDVVGHELTHGVIQNTSNLIYLNQSGALNESLADIFGEAIEAHTFGQPDWIIGGQLSSPLRSFSDPGSFNFSRGRPYPATMSDFVQLPPTPEGDLGGIHINSSIINHAFYLLAEGLNGAIGINDAAQIFYRAMVFHLVPRSRFLDTRLAVIQSATEIYGEDSIQAQKAAEAFDAVEIFDAPATPDTGVFSRVTGSDATIFIEFDSRNGGYFLKRRDPALNDPATGTELSFFAVAPKRPSVDRNTGLVAFINSNNVLCTVSSNSGRIEECNESIGKISSIAISADGNQFAVVFRDRFGQPENRINIIDATSNITTRTFGLVASATEGASTTTIDNADVMDFTNNGQFLVYDAFNEITIGNGSTIGVWSIYALDLVNEIIIALVPPLQGFHFAFPSLSQTTDDYLTFDAFNLDTRINTITTASLITGETQNIHTSDTFGVPSFSGDDNAVIFSQIDQSAAISLFRQPLLDNHITPSGSSELWLKNADYGVIFRRGNTITSPSSIFLPQEGLWWDSSKPGSGFDIQVTSKNDLALVWYTYDLNGRPIWYLASGPLNGDIWNANLVEYTWDGRTAIPSNAGTARLTFSDDSHAALQWTLNTGNGFADIEYFIFDQTDTVKTGTWFEQARPGYGLTQVEQGTTQVEVLYFYDLAGNPKWALGSGPLTENTTLMNTFSGSCPVCPFVDPVASPAGTVTTSFTDQLTGILSTDIVLPSPLFGTWQIVDATITNLSQ